MAQQDNNSAPMTAEDLRKALLQREMDKIHKAEKARAAETERLSAFTEDFLKHDVTEEERAMIRRLVQNAVNDGKFEALVYTFPSDLCTDSGRAINNGDPNWPDTLQGKARQLFDRYETVAKPAGFKLKAMIINFPGGVPGDVGFFLNWAPEQK